MKKKNILNWILFIAGVLAGTGMIYLILKLFGVF